MSQAYEVLIRESHLDTFGHVNNATYLSLYEEARWQLITGRGFGYKDILEKQIGPIIMDVHLRFLIEIRLRETIQISTELVSYEGKVGKLKQQILNADGKIASDAIFTFGLFDLTSRKLIPPTPEWLAAVQN